MKLSAEEMATKYAGAPGNPEVYLLRKVAWLAGHLAGMERAAGLCEQLLLPGRGPIKDPHNTSIGMCIRDIRTAAKEQP